MKSATQIMEGMGFPATETGPHVTELRKVIEAKVAEGMVGHSYGTWARDDLSNEERARALLEVHWSIEHGHSYRQEVMDSTPIDWRFSTKTMRWHLEIKPSRLLPWIRDRFREAAMHVRIWRDGLLRRRNPYRQT